MQRLQFFPSEAAWNGEAHRFRNGRAERWWAVELTLFSYGPNKSVRAACATTDQGELPSLSTQVTSPPIGRVKQAPLAELAAVLSALNAGQGIQLYFRL